jgi:hypothetical protein
MTTNEYDGPSTPFTVDTPTIATHRTSTVATDLVPRSAGFISDPFPAHRIFTRRFSVAGVAFNSSVAVSLTEVSGIFPTLGDATMKVYNVIPDNAQEVIVRGEVDWDVDINIRASFVVVNLTS